MTISALFLSTLGLLATQASTQKAPPLFKTEQDRISYCMGLRIAMNFKDQDVSLNVDMLVKGIKDVLYGKRPAVEEEEMKQVLSRWQSMQTLKLRERAIRAPIENKAKGEKFLADNKTKPGVVSLPTGVQYLILREGSGRKPTVDNTVEVNYIGSRIDGSEFDNSYKAGSTLIMRGKETIPGWQQILPLMSVGSKWKVWIPAKYGYGPKQVGNIEPNSVLVFVIDLIDIKD